MTNTLEQGYAAAAERRRREAGEGSQQHPGTRGPWGMGLRLTGFLLAGLLLAVAAAQAWRSAPAAERAHAALVQEVDKRSADVDALTAKERRLATQNQQARTKALASASGGAATAQRLARLQGATGAVAVSGPGVDVVMDDAHETPSPLSDDATSSPGRILDRDLQQVVNALWADGAEAIAINGQRLTALSSIRAAGDAILVDFRPVSPPYHVQAIGEQDRLAAEFAAGPTAAAFRTYAQAYGLGFDVRPVARLHLPAATGLVLHVATPAPASDGASSPPSTISEGAP